MPVSSVTIAVLTYLRPNDISAVLPLLVREARLVDDALYRVRVLVVDNDPARSAREAVLGFATSDATSGVPVQYENEPEPGISAARNRALDASFDSRLLVFIDDDERPTSGWLRLLLTTWELNRPQAVVGPVVSEFEVRPDAWVEAGRFFDRRRLPTGTPVTVAATNNLLLDLDFVRATAMRFDPAYGITGGDDTMFTRQLHAAGAVLLWCDEAVVVDIVPRHRVSRRWVLQRAYSSGNSWSLVAVRLARPGVARAATRLALSGGGLLRLGGGAVRFVGGLFLRQLPLQARGARTVLRGAGLIAGAWGQAYQEYRRVPD